MLLDFKKCDLNDLELLVKISRATFTDAFEHLNHPECFQNYIDTTFSRRSLTEQLRTAASHFYLVYIKEILVGYFKWNAYGAQSDLNLPDTIELERIYVLKDFQAKNIGFHILNKVIQLAKAQNCSTLWLGLWEYNTSAIRFYERHGFIKFGEHPYVLDTDIQTDWLMKLQLKA